MTNTSTPNVLSHRRLSLAEQIACRLEQELDAVAVRGRLPPMSQLAQRYGVSKAIVCAAVHVLVRKGMLTVRRGAPTRLAGARGRTAFSDRAERLLSALRNDILEGRREAGTALEKVAAYASDYGLSRSTVLEVFQALESEGLVHRRGKRRIVGVPIVTQPLSPTHTPTILIAVPNPGYWRYYLEHYHVAPMFRTLIWELERYGIAVRVVMNEPQPWSGPYVCGFEQVQALVRKLEGRYRGMLLAGDLSGFRYWREWMAEFAIRDDARVHFFLDSAAEAESLRPVAVPRGCYRCSYDERAAGALAAHILAERGHRRAAFMVNRVYAGTLWMSRRMEAMKKSGQALGLEVIGYEQNEEFWRLKGDNAEHVEADPELFGGYECTQQRLRDGVPSLTAVIADSSITAIVAPNDNLAVHYYVWLVKAGRIPGKDISLLSFDNNHLAHSYPLSSIDLGLRKLGYQLAHLFVGDIPARPGRDGYLLAKPWFVDRGSVAEVNLE